MESKDAGETEEEEVDRWLRTLGLLEEPGGVADARLYRLPLSYRQDFVCKMREVIISTSSLLIKLNSKAGTP